MFENTCLQCKKIVEGTTNRLVLDSCGHKKCRICLLQDEEFCKQCSEAKLSGTEKCNSETSVIKFESNHATVITCNGITENESEVQNLNNQKKAEKLIEKGKTNQPKKSSRNGKRQQKNKDKRQYNCINIPSHITVELDSNTYYCTICNKSFTTKAHVKYHAYCAGAVKLYNCSICKKEFILKSQLQIHMYKHDQKKPHVCNICGKSFGEKSKLKRHIILHTALKSFVCTDCGKAFKTKESLKVHSIIHKDDKPFSCKYCKAKFNNSSNLKKHIVSHSNEKDHMCDQCGKRFKLKWALSVHQKSHFRTREHICSICQKSFINNKDLQRHNLIHVDSKAYTCSICKTSFRRKDNLSRHIRNTHPGKNADIIRNIVKPKSPPASKPVDNPNAIHVITASPAFIKNKQETVTSKPDTKTGTIINGPPKLAFKTPAFKSSYNIQRDNKIFSTYNMTDSVNICQKILSPHTSISNTSQTTNEPQISTEICQKILEPNSEPIHYETSFQNRKHAMIKNIKFKVPTQYTMNAKKDDTYKHIVPLEPVKSLSNYSEPGNNTYTQLQNISIAATSVIVNNQPSMHWRRRTSQTLNIK